MILRSASKAVFTVTDMVMRRPRGPRILIYHNVGVSTGRQMEVRVSDFEAQLSWLASNREIVDLDTAISRWAEPDADRLIVLTFDDGYGDLVTTGFPLLKKHGMPFLLYLTTGRLAEERAQPSANDLTWGQVGTMLESGLLEVGAHTHSHPDLRHIDRATIAEELELNDRLILRQLGTRPRHFAYPYGFWSESADEIVRSRYETATLGGSPNPGEAPDKFLLHRYPVQLSDGQRFFKSRLRGGLRLEEALRRRLKGYEGP